MGIQSRHAAKVNSARYAIVFALVLFSTAQSGSSARAEGSDPAVPRVPSPADTLPNIEARSFDVRVAKRSKSAKTYLFEDINQARTRVGKILLLRRDSQPVMAFRIVKTYYPAKNEFAAKQVRTYGDIAKIEPGSSYSGLEKVSDVVAPPPTAQDRADLKELESAPVQPALETLPAPTPTPEASAVPAAPTPIATPAPEPTAAAPAPATDDLMSGLEAPAAAPPAAPEKTAPIPTAPTPDVQEFDSELDAATTPKSPTEGGRESDGALAEDTGDSEEEDDERHMGVSVEETRSFDVHRSWLSAQVGYFQNVGPVVDKARGTAYFAGAGLRFGYTLGKEIFLRTSKLQDSVALELGTFIYKIVSFETAQGDSYNVAPVALTGRYNILFSENFGVFFYLGIVKNFVFSPVNPTEDTQSALGGVNPAAGGGLFFRIGPNWHVRADLGYDMIGLGLALRF